MKQWTWKRVLKIITDPMTWICIGFIVFMLYVLWVDFKD